MEPVFPLIYTDAIPLKSMELLQCNCGGNLTHWLHSGVTGPKSGHDLSTGGNIYVLFTANQSKSLGREFVWVGRFSAQQQHLERSKAWAETQLCRKRSSLLLLFEILNQILSFSAGTLRYLPCSIPWAVSMWLISICYNLLPLRVL